MKKVFLGGTCNQTQWRESLIPKLKINYFNPVVPNWNTAAYEKELHERVTCDYCLYMITAKIKGVYSIAEVIDDSNKRPQKTIFCYSDIDGPFDAFMIKSLDAVGKMVKENGGIWCKDITAVVTILNQENK